MNNTNFKKEINKLDLNINEKTRSNLFNWRGQFSPQLIETLIKNYAEDDVKIFDPFLGSGTVLFEAGKLGFEAAGTELNPSAAILSKVYELINISKARRNFVLKNLDTFVMNSLSKSIDNEHFVKKLIKYTKNKKSSSEVKIINALIILLDGNSNLLSKNEIVKTWNRLQNIIEILPYSTKKIEVFNRDARKTKLKENTIDLVITSPPYINVFNYHQNYRKSVEKLNFDILDIAKSEIGSNRKNRSNRFLTVVQYGMEMAESLFEVKRISKANSRFIYIVGRESNIRATKFYNSDLILQILEQMNFKIVGIQERSFLNKFGKTIYEDILRFEHKNYNEKIINNHIEIGREIAIAELEKALKKSDISVKQDLENALIKAPTQETSKIFN